MLELLNVEQFKKDYNDKMSITVLAKKNFVSTNTVYRWLDKYEIKGNRKNPTIKIDINEDKLYQLRVVERQSYKKIGKVFNVSSDFIRTYCIKLKFPKIAVIRAKGRWECATVGGR